MRESVSICIPCYEFKGHGAYYLRRLLRSIASQDCLYNGVVNKAQIVINDQSCDDSIYTVYKEFICTESPFAVTYCRHNSGARSNSTGTNNALLASLGTIIKPMFQDDFFVGNESLADVVNGLTASTAQWAACSTIHYYEESAAFKDVFKPHIKSNSVSGMAIGCPSNVIFRRDAVFPATVSSLFDTNLVWLMDCEFYWRLYNRVGAPAIIDRVCIANGVNEHRISADTERMQNLAITEEAYLRRKYASNDRFAM